MAERYAAYRGTFRAAFTIAFLILLYCGGQSHGYPVPDDTLWWSKFWVSSFAIVSLLAFWFDWLIFFAGLVIFVPLAGLMGWGDLMTFIERHR